jgi:hypothetical protein
LHTLVTDVHSTAIQRSVPLGMSSASIPEAYKADIDKVICKTCGAQYPHQDASPRAGCPICLDDRQYVPPSGQAWTSLRELLEKDVKTVFEPYVHDARVIRLRNEPGVGISQTRELVLALHTSARTSTKYLTSSDPHRYGPRLRPLGLHGLPCPLRDRTDPVALLRPKAVPRHCDLPPALLQLRGDDMPCAQRRSDWEVG